MENLTWLEAMQFCNQLSLHEGLTPAYRIEGDTVSWDRRADGCRLPTEAEWEYAARAGSSTEFSFGHQIVSSQVNFEGSYSYLIEENYVHHDNPEVRTSAYRGQPIAAGELPANAFGLRHMHGNVSEWVFDYYAPYTDNAQDPTGPAE